MLTTVFTERSRNNPTRFPCPTPALNKHRASLLLRALSSEYVSADSPHDTATRVGLSAAWISKISAIPRDCHSRCRDAPSDGFSTTGARVSFLNVAIGLIMNGVCLVQIRAVPHRVS